MFTQRADEVGERLLRDVVEGIEELRNEALSQFCGGCHNTIRGSPNQREQDISTPIFCIERTVSDHALDTSKTSKEP